MSIDDLSHLSCFEPFDNGNNSCCCLCICARFTENGTVVISSIFSAALIFRYSNVNCIPQKSPILCCVCVCMYKNEKNIINEMLIFVLYLP